VIVYSLTGFSPFYEMLSAQSGFEIGEVAILVNSYRVEDGGFQRKMPWRSLE